MFKPKIKCLTIMILIISLTIVTSMDFQAGSEREIIITDALGRTVKLHGRPSRIVSLSPTITEILFYLNLQDYIVGVDSISINDPYFNISSVLKKRGVVDVGGYWYTFISIEKIIDLQPDLVIADKGAHLPLLEVFEKYNITVVYLNGGSSTSLNDIYRDMEIVASIYGLEERVLDFISKVEEEFNKYRDLFKQYSNLKVLIVIDISDNIWVAGRLTYMDELLSRLGLQNAARVTGWKPVSIEQIYDWSPDVVLIVSNYVTEDSIKNSGLENICRNIIVLNPQLVDSLSRPGPLILNVPSELYKVFNRFVTNTMITETSVDYTLLYYIIVFTIGLIIGAVVVYVWRK